MAKLPVATVQVGCVTAPNVGCIGVVGCTFTVEAPEDTEAQVPKVAVNV